jgi:hypothetical protein
VENDMSETSELLTVAGLVRESQQPRIIHRLNVWELPDRTHSAEGVRVVHKCGCKIIGGGTCPHPFEIQYCPTHAAVTEEAIAKATP